MDTFECPKCGAPVSYEPNAFGAGSVKCAYCQSQLSLPHHGQPARIISQIDINVGPEIRAGAKKAAWLMVVIPLAIIILIVVGVLAGVFSALAPLSKSNPFGFGGGRSSAGDPNAFAHEVLKFGSEGIGPGMMTDARSIGTDGKGNIYVGEYQGGRVQVFDTNGKFVTQWTVGDRKTLLRGLAADRKGTIYFVHGGGIDRYRGETGEKLGQVEYQQSGFDDVTTTADGGLVTAWQSNRDDIVTFDANGKHARTIPAAISSASGDSELSMRVAVDGAGNIYALGRFNDAVFKFGRDGKFINRFGSGGDQPGQFRAAYSIAVDGYGRIYVGDMKGIQVFDANGRYLTVLSLKGMAFGMVFNDKNELFVVARDHVIKYAIPAP